MFVAIPTAIPADPFTSKFGKRLEVPLVLPNFHQNWGQNQPSFLNIRQHLNGQS